MNSLLSSALPATKIDPFQTAQTLAFLLKETQEYKAFIQAQKALNGDPASYRLSMEMRSHQDALRRARDLDGQHAAELARLELQMEEQPVVQEYRLCTKNLGELFQAVEKMISQEAGMDFAINAQRGGCACGG
jgi:cell fate (sporulation/competence/biofilm development) regulator YmcA (YheA/YmcA/DUF963 family)